MRGREGDKCDDRETEQKNEMQEEEDERTYE